MLLERIKENKLLGRSGSRFPVAKKWESLAAKTGKKYLICNGAEGEPGVFKDKYILKTDPKKVIAGIEKTMKALGINRCFFYLRKDYKKALAPKLKSLIEGKKIEIVEKEDRYVAGEETAAINSIEGLRAEPSIKPPFPTEVGIGGRPTLVHNVETMYAIEQIAQDEYKHERFYCIFGKVKNEGVFKLKNNLTLEEILKKTDNYPDFDFLIQVGGGAGGVFLTDDNLQSGCNRLGSIEVFRADKFDPLEKMKSISWFLMHGNCDQCTPCREGIYRINKMLEREEYNREVLDDILFALDGSSYCPLGKVAAEVFKSLDKIYEN